MTFDKTKFGPVGGQSSRGKVGAVYSYKSTDAATAVDDSGYFNDLSDMLEVGDLIYRVTLDTTGAVSTAGFHIVVSNASGVVDVMNTDALTITDTD